MLNVFGILNVVIKCAFNMIGDINPKTGDYYTDEEINRFLGLPEGVDPLDYLVKMEQNAIYLMSEINPKTGKYYTSDEIAHIIGLLKDCS